MPSSESTPNAGDMRPGVETTQRAQRIAMLGSLSRGVGHDLRNIVMPALLRLDVLAASTEMSARTRVDLASIRNSLMQLQHLAEGLSLLSADTVGHADDSGFTRLDDWWADLRMILAEALPPKTALTTSISPDLPAAAIAPAALAQVVASILLMTAQSIADEPAPSVHIGAMVDEADCLHLEIRHSGKAPARALARNAPARNDDQFSRFGLETCRALVERFGGKLRLETSEADGTTFLIQLQPAAPDRRQPRRVRVLISDPRILAVVRMVLMQRRVIPVPFADTGPADTIICDALSLASVLSARDDASDATTIIALGAPQESPNDIQWIDAYDSDALGRALG